MVLVFRWVGMLNSLPVFFEARQSVIANLAAKSGGAVRFCINGQEQ